MYRSFNITKEKCGVADRDSLVNSYAEAKDK